jgi:hypothetical protein
VAVVNPPLWLQAGAYTARQDRRLISSLVGSEGVSGELDMLVTQRAAGANMSVDVSEGVAFIEGEEATTQGTYHVESQGATNVVIAAAHATLPRSDPVNAWALEVETGTPAGSPVEPSVPVSAIPLARVHVTPAATSITNTNITDRRPRSRILGGVHVATSTTLPSLLDSQEGEVAYATDLSSLYVRTASAWTPVGHSRVLSVGSSLNIASTSYQSFGSLSVPAGRWLIQAKGVAVSTNAQQSDVQLWNSTDGVSLDDSTQYGVTSYRIPFHLLGWATYTTTKTVQVRGKLASVVAGTHVMDNVKMWAIPVSALI